MSITKNGFKSAITLMAMLGWVGCSKSPATNSPSGTPPAAAHSEGDGHDHAEHAHATEGPHHGHLIELGQEEYHAELVHDEATKTVTIYLLDASAKQSVPIGDQEITLNLVVDGTPQQVKLAAAAQEGDPSGQSSRFSIMDEKVLEALEAPKTTGQINFTIAGKTYTGKIEHHEHGDHKHE